MRSMEFSVREVNDVVVAQLRGKITASGGSEALQEHCEGLLSSGRKHILFNLHDVTYMDSSGLGALIACHNLARGRGAVVKLVNPSNKVYDLLHTTKLSDVFETYREEPAALSSFPRR